MANPKSTTTTAVRVCCSDCRRFSRDKSGPSFSIQTGEYFMGTCLKGHADGSNKVFADKPRNCSDHIK